MTLTEAFLGGPSRVWADLAGSSGHGLSGWSFHWQTPWAVILALGVWAIALTIKHFITEVVEDEHTFLGIIVGFMAIYVVAAVAVGTLSPAYASG